MEVLQKLTSNEMSWDEIRGAFGNYLGLPEAVPSAVLKKAIEDEKYASYIISVRNNPEYLKMLFDVEPNVKEDYSNLQLIGKAAKSLLRWGASGFGFVSDTVYAARLNVCRSCEYLREAPEKAVYNFKMSNDTDDRTCSACGCVASRKARLASESCPVKSKNDHSLNRWGEAMKQA